MKSLILGHGGMLGAAIHHLIPDANVDGGGVDLRNKLDVATLFSYLQSTQQRPEVVYMCAARVGGIGRNVREPGRMIYDNLQMELNVIDAAMQTDVAKVVLIGSSCMYPGVCPLGRWHESQLFSGIPEETNSAYAVAKLAGVEMLRAYKRQYGMDYLVPIPCNLYGPGDSFDLEDCHFLPAMIRRFHERKTGELVTLWGTGSPLRELMHVNDAARIIVELVRQGCTGEVNIGPGEALTIRAWAHLVGSIVTGRAVTELAWDESKPDGVDHKTLDVDRMKRKLVGPKINPRDGIRETYDWYRASIREESAR